MGSTGAKKGGGGTDFSKLYVPDLNYDKFTDFGQGGTNGDKWFDNPKLSNAKDWRENQLTPAEKSAIDDYTGVGYHVNDYLYTKPFEDMSIHYQGLTNRLEDALNKFSLNKGINTTRQTDFKVFKGAHTIDGIKNFLAKNGGFVQHNGFVSSGADNHGVSIAGSGLVIHYKVPPSDGAGAYVRQLGMGGENEYLFNRNAIFHYDANSLYKGSDGKIHVTAIWVGRNSKQVF